MSMYVESLKTERAGCVNLGKTARVAAIDAELKRLGVDAAVAPQVETAMVATPETAAVKRGPGRPRKD